MPRNRDTILILILLVGGNLFAWQSIFTQAETKAELHFLDVGQGDSTLVRLPAQASLPNGVVFMVDAGPPRNILAPLDKIMGRKRYIDLAFITHPELDHFGGYNELLEHYDVGAFVWNGRDKEESGEWRDLTATIKKRGIPMISLEAGNAVRSGSARLDIISPGPENVLSGALNDTSLVMKGDLGFGSFLLTGDIGANTEEYLRRRYDIKADILKVSHHGSKYSSDKEFLSEVNAAVALIGVGLDNGYGHPAPAALSRLTGSGILNIMRTDTNGSIKITGGNDRVKVFWEKIDAR